jgi:hypothetical protein
MKRLGGWNRLFVVIAICWAIVAPFLVMGEVNEPVRQRQSQCAESAYQRYGSSQSTVRLDWDKYHAEEALCLNAFVQDYVGLEKLFGALIGMGDRTLGLVAWGVILIPLCLLWVVCWALGKVVLWVAAGFRH